MATSAVFVQTQGEPANLYEHEHLNVTSSGTVDSNAQSNDSNQPSTTNNQRQDASNAVSEQGQQNGVELPDPVDEAGSDEESDLVMERTYLKILGLATLASVPLVLTSVFLGMLQSNTVHRTTRDILVRFQATRLLIPLQIAAIVAPFTIGILMKLWAYHIGKRYAEQGGSIILSHQFLSQHAMLIEYLFFPGGLTTLRALGYTLTPLREGRLRNSKIVRIFPKNGRSEMMPNLRSVTTILCFSAFLCFGLSILITVIQGVASVENYEQVTAIRENLGSFGRELPPKCAETYILEVNGTEEMYSCSLKPGPGGWLHAEAAEALNSLNNESSVNSILWDSQNKIAFLAPPVVNRFTDFKTATVGIHSSCTPKGKGCGLHGGTSNTIAYQTCSGLDFQDYNKPTSSLSLSQGAARAIEFTGPGDENPFHYWIWANIQADPSSPLLNDEEVLALNNSVSILLDCEISIFNYTYSFTNGTLSQNSLSSGFSVPSNTKLVNNSAAEVILDPLTVSFGMREIYERLRAYTASLSSAAAIADATGRSVSETALGYAAGLFVKTEALAQSTREDVLVTRLPVVLVVLCSLFGLIIAIEGLVLAVLAVVDVRAERRAVRELSRMRLKALVEASL